MCVAEGGPFVIKLYTDPTNRSFRRLAGGAGGTTHLQIQKLMLHRSATVEVRHTDVMQNAIMVMNTNASHTKNIATRRAIIHAVDKARFIKEEFAGLEQPVTQLLPFNTPFCS